ncbi:MAG: class I SAM-dependent methyltransferase [Anaerolineae bacterium]
MLSDFVHRMACDVCGSDVYTILISKDYLDPAVVDFLASYYSQRIDLSILRDAHYEVARCSVCGFMWQTYILNDRNMQLLYDVWISEDDSLKKKTLAPLALRARYATEAYTIAELLRKPPHDVTVLDFGMGWGYWCLMAKSFGYRTYGAELSETRVQYATANGISVLNLDTVSAGQFDFINSEQVFEHIPQPLMMLRTLVTTLKPSGVIRISVPDSERSVSQLASPDWKPAKDAFHPLEHINSFTHTSLIELGRRAGLRPLESVPPIYFGVLSRRQAVRRLVNRRKPPQSTTLYFVRDGAVI